MEKEVQHQPVMLQQVLDLADQAYAHFQATRAENKEETELHSPDNFTLLDGTLGAGGHSLALARRYSKASCIFSDRDPEMVERARSNFLALGMSPDESRFQWWRKRASQPLPSDLELDFALLDLGISMLHLKEFDRGFSYEDQTLDMRLDEEGPSASELINELPEKELADLIYKYGEERASRKIAARIVRERPVLSARQLADIVVRCIPGPRNRPHPARKTFQALRIAVNDELDEAQKAARNLAAHLRSGGILAIITFHSLEDRIIKQCFADLCGMSGAGISRYDAPLPEMQERKPAQFEKAVRKSLAPSESEKERNPAARSARLRAIRRKPVP
ncbi:MAG: 16S rRNA (cytosine(1402)-N(4))-methyltransferase RsmH [Leptospiraceae bacterium]|nr:16S rRNA (cytosine(1402)-N(4))-methyltransferase RsmH [Leptospiraceae bacterium]